MQTLWHSQDTIANWCISVSFQSSVWENILYAQWGIDKTNVLNAWETTHALKEIIVSGLAGIGAMKHITKYTVIHAIAYSDIYTRRPNLSLERQSQNMWTWQWRLLTYFDVSTTNDVCTRKTGTGHILTEKSLFLSITIFIGARKCTKINSYICNYPYSYIYTRRQIFMVRASVSKHVNKEHSEGQYTCSRRTIKRASAGKNWLKMRVCLWSEIKGHPASA